MLRTRRAQEERLESWFRSSQRVERIASARGHFSQMVLLAQDDPCLRREIASHLRREGLSVIEVSRGEDAMVWLSTCAHQDPVLPFPDLLVSAVELPDLGGLEILERMRASGEPLPAVLLASRTTDPLRRRASELGGCLVLEGSFRIEEILAAVHLSLGLQLAS